MKKLIVFAMVFSGCLVGCGQSTPSDDKALREGFNKKDFNINDVPAENRERVRGFMRANGAASAAATH